MTERPVKCSICGGQMYYMGDPRHEPEVEILLRDNPREYSYTHRRCLDNSMQHTVLMWTKQRPTMAEVLHQNNQGVAYYWVRGLNYNRPVMCEVNAGGSIARGPELNYSLPDYAENTWESEMLYELSRCEWAGPIPLPEEAK
jgi:hypothetical protein